VTQISYASELARKSIHLTSVMIPIIYLRVEHRIGILVLICMTLTSLLIDVGRHYHRPTRALLMKLVGPLLRTHELQEERFRLTGATWVLIAATLTLAVFPTLIGVTAFTILIISDTFAALVGRQFKSGPFLDKSIAGSATFAITAMIVVAIYASIFTAPWTFWAAGAVASATAAVVEASAIRMRMDDNISIPFSFGIAMMLLDWLAQYAGFPSFTV
jgi:dolichol kinase